MTHKRIYIAAIGRWVAFVAPHVYHSFHGMQIQDVCCDYCAADAHATGHALSLTYDP